MVRVVEGRGAASTFLKRRPACLAGIRTACSFVIVGVVVAACGVDPAVERSEALASFEAGDLRSASIHISNVLQADPNDAGARLLRGRIALASGNPALARGELERARELGGAEAEVNVSLGDALAQLGESAAALELLDRVPEAAQDRELWLVRGEALLAAGRADEASEALRRSVELGGESTRQQIALARLGYLQRRTEDVGALLDRAVDIAKLPYEEANALAARASHSLQSRQLEAAVADLRRASDLYGQNAVGAREIAVLSTLAQLQLTLNDLDGAREAAARLAARAPLAAITSYFEGVVALRDGSYRLAVTKLQQAVNLTPENSVFRTMLGAAHLAQGNLGQAEQQLRSAAAGDPGNPAASKLLAEARLRQRRPADALAALRALPPDGVDSELDLLRGVANLQAGDMQQAIDYFEQAVQRTPDDEALQLQLAQVYFAAGRDADALELLERLSTGEQALNAGLMSLFALLRSADLEGGRAAAEELIGRFPQEPRSHAAAAMVHQAAGDEAAAESSLRTAIELDPAFAPARLLLAALLVRTNRAEEAERLLVDALKEDPANPQVLSSLAQLAAARGDFARAESLLARGAEAAPQVPQIRYALGEVKLRLGHTDEAVKIARSLQADFPEQYEGYLLEGDTGVAQGRYADAVAGFESAFDRAPEWAVLVKLVQGLAQASRGDEIEPRLRAWLDERPEHAEGRLLLAERMQSSGRAAEALDEYNRVLQSSPDNVVALNNAAWLYRERDLERALSLVQRASALAPDHPAVLDTWGWILTETERADEGIVHLRRAAALAPDTPDIQYHFAYALNEVGRTDEARRVLDAVLARSQTFSTRAEAEALLKAL